MTALALPGQLQPWADALALFPPDQASTMRELLQRLAPLLGPLRQLAATAAREPEGVGAIVQRGPFERMLISEWAYADAAPDEFLRRAANGELLFTGPEPATSRRPLRSVVLFDAGPSQLGAARLLHVALLILLARRAQLASAQFEWGVLQEPGVLHQDAGAPGIARLLKSRSYATPERQAADAWAGVFDTALEDCWLVGDPATVAPVAMFARADIRRSWGADELTLVLTQSGRTRRVTLPLPDETSAVRLLRQAADAAPRARAMVTAPAAHSLKRAPLFGTHPDFIAVATVDGAVTLYHVPPSVRATPGRPRSTGKLGNFDSIVAAGLCKRGFGILRQSDGALHPSGFPGSLFNATPGTSLDLPDRSQFHALPGTLHWAQAFHMRLNDRIERLLVLDRERRLVCWTRTRHAGSAHVSDEFTPIASDVIGVRQHENGALSYALSAQGNVKIYFLDKENLKSRSTGAHVHQGDLYYFGPAASYALRLPDRRWLVGDQGGAMTVPVEEGSKVLGCAWNAASGRYELVVLTTKRLRFEFYAEGARTVLITSPEKIAHASFDPAMGRLAWLTHKSGMLVVQGLGQSEPFLQALGTGGSDEP